MTLPGEHALSALRRPYGKDTVAALTGSEAEALDRFAIEDLGIASPVLIEAAGRAAAAIAQQLKPDGPVVVLAGKGNNGADAVVVARTLVSWGRDVTLVEVSGPTRPDFLHGWPMPTVQLESSEAPIRTAAMVVDGILGTGLRGRPREPEATAIGLVNQTTGLKVALDVPSGVNATTGAVEGEAVQADVTIGFGAAKVGSVLYPGRTRVGRHVVVDIGFPPIPHATTHLVTPGWTSARLPRRSSDAHKTSVGAVAVIAGSPGMAGAAVLAARAAMRVGAGYTRVITDAGNRDIVQSALPEAVFVDRDDPGALAGALSASRAVLLGPGLGTDGRGAQLVGDVVECIDSGTPLVIDADALTLLANAESELDRSRLSGLTVLLTPHLGEMSRLVGRSTDQLKTDVLGASRALAGEWSVHVLLKGAPTVVTDARGLTWVAGSQSSDLAVAGMGDTLAGTIAGLSAQGMPLAEAAASALEVTARAAQLAGGGVGLMPSDVTEHLAAAAMEDGDGHTDLPFAFVMFDQDPPR